MKTLDEINLFKYIEHISGTEKKLANKAIKDILKAELKKWIEELKSTEEDNYKKYPDSDLKLQFECEDCESEGFHGNCDNIVKFIKHFIGEKAETSAED